MSATRLAALYCYPLKSARGIALSSAVVEARGLRDDRRWMLVDAGGRFITQRRQPRMALIETAFEASDRAGELLLAAPDCGQVAVPRGGGEAQRVEVWGDWVDAEGCGAAADAWLAGFLGIDCRIVYLPEHSRRAVHPDAAVYRDDIVGFADYAPMLLLGSASLDELNGQMDAPLPMDRFRPNLVVEGCAAYAEDGWARIRVGDCGLHLVEHAERCALTTVDQASGARAGREPLATLSRLRNREGSMLFGQYAVLARLGEGDGDAVGELRVGDALEVLERQPPPVFTPR